MILPNHDRYYEYKDEELEEFLKKFPDHADRPLVFREQDRREKLKDDRKAEERDQTSKTRHDETIGVDKKTLSWAKIAGIAGIAAVLIGAVSLAAQIYFSKAPPSTPATPSPTSSPQTIATISESPEPAATANSATPSPKPVATE